jgi:hypothetical protein
MPSTDFADHCARGRPACSGLEVISRHPTSTGVVSYIRCVCGGVQVRIRPYDTGQTVVHVDQRAGGTRWRPSECGDRL